MFHQHMLAATVSPSEKSLPPFPHVTIAECIERLSRYGTYDQDHDVAILKMCADQKKIFTPEDLTVASCSFFATRTCVGFHRSPFSIPDHIMGYVDVIQLRNLGKETKELINKLEAERGWTITRFEDYDKVDTRSETS
jgi:hypothetical protein